MEREYIDIINLCDKLIESQEKYIEQFDAEHPDRPWATSQLAQYSNGRREAWEQIRQYCAREALWRMDEADRVFADKLRKLAGEENLD